MATQTKPSDIFDVQGAVERIADANRKAGNDYLDLYEKAVGQLTALELRTAEAVKLPAVAEIAKTHADVTRKVAKTYTNRARAAQGVAPLRRPPVPSRGSRGDGPSLLEGGPSRVKVADVTEPTAFSLGEIIRRQRELSRLSMRRFAQMAGISNPYLSQIERGLREPSERVVDAIARSLETTAEALYEEAGLVAEEDGTFAAVPLAIAADPALTPRQRKVMLEVYEAFVAAGPASPPRRRRGAAGPANAS